MSKPKPIPAQPTAWHAMAPAEALTRLSATATGLSSEQASQRQQQYGANRLTPAKQRSALMRLLLQFHNVLIYVLLAAAALTVALQHYTDAAVIAVVVILNAVIGFLQEGKAERALEAISQMLSPQALVSRDGHKQNLAADQLVPGDIVHLNPGDRVPADIRLLQVTALRADEALLTGEAVPASKSVEAVANEAVLGDRRCLLYSGSLITSGTGTGVVVETGDNTEIGRISAILGQVETLTTPLLRQMDRFGQQLTFGIVVMALVTMLFGALVRDYSLADMFLAAVGLAVAAIPEGLPAIMTITLALGVQRMVQQHAIVRRLPAVETLGSVTVICSDKTGTLTRNEMTATTIATVDGRYAVSGVGYQPDGQITFAGLPPDQTQQAELSSLLRAGLLCNDASLHPQDDHWISQGDPTEIALVTLAHKSQLAIAETLADYPRLAAIPFESEHRFMATLHQDQLGHQFIYVKGAPERLMEMCSCQRANGEQQPLNRNYWLQQMHAMASQGQRVLAIGERIVGTPLINGLHYGELEHEITLLGLIGIIDPPRSEAIDAVTACHQAGIRVKMITGDHALTAVSIASQLGIGDGETVLSGHHIDELSPQELQARAMQVDVFARTSPEHKLQLVQALQASGQVLAMTGDGVNDAPSLKQADIGIAMGDKGTEVAKEAAEMVLTDDNFATIARAVGEGRTVYDNLKKSILFILPTNGGEALTIMAAIVLGIALPITPVQILWVNMITAVTLALAFAFEPAESDVMQRKPRQPGEAILSRMLIWRILFVSLILVCGTFGLFYFHHSQGASLELARTIAVNTLVMFEIFYLFNTRSIQGPVLNYPGLCGNRIALYAIGLLLLFQLAFTYLPPMQALFDTQAMTLHQWLQVILVASSVLWLVELEKWLGRSRKVNEPD
ncbi:cation-transporting P-type ATPase [Oceanobacter mangrovi]|uniref:cation-transporting P-type ATPase n=1 Tax=Oceanobacter mangrovi TaxID=2862510 RepID=UPI001C8DF3CF|nr:cation-transporting P-type ATPase [Oceanobacter mangrovi]